MHFNRGGELKYICMQINLLATNIDETLLHGFNFNYCNIKRKHMDVSDHRHISLHYNIFVKDYDETT